MKDYGMIIPECYRHQAIRKCQEMLKDPDVQIPAWSNSGIVVRNKKYQLSVTKEFIYFRKLSSDEPAQE